MVKLTLTDKHHIAEPICRSKEDKFKLSNRVGSETNAKLVVVLLEYFNRARKKKVLPTMILHSVLDRSYQLDFVGETRRAN